MPSIRFATVRDLYDAFPTAQDDVGMPPSEEPSLAFLQSLVSKQSWSEAISFCAYLLPRREAVWWGCQSVRRIQSDRSPQETAALDIAEAWVREPEENRRREALTLGTKSNPRSPTTWMLLGAGWSGGSVVAPEIGMVPAAPQQTARAVSTGVLMALAWIPKEETAKVAKPCLESGIALAAGERRS